MNQIFAILFILGVPAFLFWVTLRKLFGIPVTISFSKPKFEYICKTLQNGEQRWYVTRTINGETKYLDVTKVGEYIWLKPESNPASFLSSEEATRAKVEYDTQQERRKHRHVVFSQGDFEIIEFKDIVTGEEYYEIFKSDAVKNLSWVKLVNKKKIKIQQLIKSTPDYDKHHIMELTPLTYEIHNLLLNEAKFHGIEIIDDETTYEDIYNGIPDYVWEVRHTSRYESFDKAYAGLMFQYPNEVVKIERYKAK